MPLQPLACHFTTTWPTLIYSKVATHKCWKLSHSCSPTTTLLLTAYCCLLPSCHCVWQWCLLLYIMYITRIVWFVLKKELINIRQITIVHCIAAQSLWTLSKVTRPSVLKPLDRLLDRLLCAYTAYSWLQSHSIALGNTKLGPAPTCTLICAYMHILLTLPMELNNRLLTHAFSMLDCNYIWLFVDNWPVPDAQ